ncbi:MAG TPA: hypothetical protein VNT26_03530, partial [Candidatus Sulfotelmatobacter sp.]|nr:hypothetical protein [Candidatus Sulfotelmatobacter sp.]
MKASTSPENQPRVRLRQCLSTFLVLFCCLSLGAVAGQTNPPAPAAHWDTFSDTWMATDGLGRTLPGAEVCGAPRPGKVVGIFYFLWLEGKGPVYDLTKLLAKDPAKPAYGPPGAFHFWGEPLFGYYRSDDEWVIRRHASLLADAGIDVVIFDVTNGFTYDNTYLALCRVFTELRRQGLRTPQIAFIAHSGSDKVVRSLYQNFYAKNLYPDLWFRWQGRPLFLASPKGLDGTLTNFFTLRESWAWTDPRGWFGNGQDK